MDSAQVLQRNCCLACSSEIPLSEAVSEGSRYGSFGRSDGQLPDGNVLGGSRLIFLVVCDCWSLTVFLALSAILVRLHG